MNALDFVTVENVMPIEFCKEFITQSNKEKWSKHKWTYDYNKSENATIDEKKEWCDVQYITPKLQDLLIPFTHEAIDIYSNKFMEDNMSVLITKFSTPRLNRYQVGQGMSKHYDHIHSLFADNEGIPVLSLVGVFNDNYEGGNFVVRDKQISLKTGDILIMPSIFIYPHKVTKVTKGVRHSFVSWAY
tara:strand:+ start:1201 stop:1761 length:561 start_codon:yes stop_codon:yes gene_type:complete